MLSDYFGSKIVEWMVFKHINKGRLNMQKERMKGK